VWGEKSSYGLGNTFGEGEGVLKINTAEVQEL